MDSDVPAGRTTQAATLEQIALRIQAARRRITQLRADLAAAEREEADALVVLEKYEPAPTPKGKVERIVPPPAALEHLVQRTIEKVETQVVILPEYQKLLDAIEFRKKQGKKATVQLMCELLCSDPKRVWSKEEVARHLGETKDAVWQAGRRGVKLGILIAPAANLLQAAPIAPVKPVVSAAPPPENKLVTDNLDLVDKMASHMDRGGLPRHITKDDLISAGRIALLELVQRYEPNKGVPFRAYAKTRVHGAMIDEIRRTANVSRQHYEEIKMGSAEPVHNVEIHAAADVPISTKDLEAELDKLKQLKQIEALVSRLPQKLQRIYKLRVLEGRKLLEIAQEFEISEARASQLYSALVERLRAGIEAQPSSFVSILGKELAKRR